MKLKYLRRTGLLISLLLMIFVVLYNNQSVHLTAEDKTFIERFLKDWHISQTPAQVHKNFTSELNFISTVQDSVISQIKHWGIPHKDFGNVAGYYAHRKGQCYDRAILMEKILDFYHFRFRHIYMYFGRNGSRPTSFDFFRRYLASHALIEVKTGKGWLAVGTNTNWLGVDSSGQLLTIGAFRKLVVSKNAHLKKSITLGMQPFWKDQSDFRFVYGIYSRHGDFFNHVKNVSLSSFSPSFHLLPDYNLKMFFYNFTR